MYVIQNYKTPIETKYTCTLSYGFALFFGVYQSVLDILSLLQYYLTWSYFRLSINYATLPF